MKLAHSRQDGLAGFRVFPDMKRRVLRPEFLKRLVEFFFVGRRAQLHREINHRLRKLERPVPDGVLRVAQGVPRERVLESGDGDDASRARGVQSRTLVRKHLKNPRGALLLLPAGVVDPLPDGQPTRVDPQIRQAPAPIGHDLEGQSGERGVGGVVPGSRGSALRSDARNGREIAGGGQGVHDRVEQGLDTHVSKTRAAQDGNRLARYRDPPDGLPDLVRLDLSLAFRQVFLQKDLVRLGHRLQQDLARRGRGAPEIFGNFNRFVMDALAIRGP